MYSYSEASGLLALAMSSTYILIGTFIKWHV